MIFYTFCTEYVNFYKMYNMIPCQSFTALCTLQKWNVTKYHIWCWRIPYEYGGIFAITFSSINPWCRFCVQIPQEKQLAMSSPIIFMKARKNQIERDGMRRAHIRDAVALCDFLAHFEEWVSTTFTLICCIIFLQYMILIEETNYEFSN
jgi:hypothetical protein